MYLEDVSRSERTSKDSGGCHLLTHAQKLSADPDVRSEACNVQQDIHEDGVRSRQIRSAKAVIGILADGVGVPTCFVDPK